MQHLEFRAIPPLLGRLISFIFLAFIVIFAAPPARASDVFVGGSTNGSPGVVATDVHQEGSAFEVGYRTDKLGFLRLLLSPQAYLFGSVSTKDDFDFVSAGLDWRIKTPTLHGHATYAQLGLGASANTAKTYRLDTPLLPPLIYQARADYYKTHADVGSNLLWEPEVALGVQVNRRVSAELFGLHMSHSRMAARENAGIDLFGARLNLKIGKLN